MCIYIYNGNIKISIMIISPTVTMVYNGNINNSVTMEI